MTGEVLERAAGSGPAGAPGFLLRACPRCGAAAPGTPETASRPAAESLPFAEVKRCWHGFFQEKVFFSYHRCSGCGLLFSPRYFRPEQMGELYGQMPDNTAGVPVDLLRMTQRGYFDALRRHSPLKGEYLEVGPDIGLFTENCVREGSFERYWLFEPNRAVLPELEKALDGRPRKVFAKDLDMSEIPDGRLAAVVMIHVLDHVLDPGAMLAQLRRKLAKGAVVLFVTHDESSLLARVLRAGWPPYCLQHPHLFRPATITDLLGSAGYRVLEIRKTSNHFPFFYLARHLLWALGLKGLPLPGWDRPAVPLKLGNILTVATPL